ncbi:helix-turn-helix transcriptional regulator [Nocardia beijingensis]|uniref:helix-turn-helix transcriptional regulator n=1 Tax=Nocardia beijingensis TaxID=95162 RepID=UPI003F4C6C00
MRELLTTKEVSELTGIPVGTLRFWRHSGIGMASFALRKRVVYRRSEVERWIAEQESATKRGGCDVA